MCGIGDRMQLNLKSIRSFQFQHIDIRVMHTSHRYLGEPGHKRNNNLGAIGRFNIESTLKPKIPINNLHSTFNSWLIPDQLGMP